MLSFNTPGVYIREVEAAPPTPLPISVTGFVGQAERGPLNTPQLLTNWGQFRDIFGDFTGYSYLAYAVFGYFLNGGSRCYVVRVAGETATRAALSLLDADGAAALRVEAIDEGEWPRAVAVTVEAGSGKDLLLATLAGGLAYGGSVATLSSVAGLAAGDTVVLVHPRAPTQETLAIASIDRLTGQVTFAGPATSAGGFPAGSSVLGRGFKLTCRYRPDGQILREEVFDNLSLDAASPRSVERIVNGDPEEKDYARRIQAGLSILVRVRRDPAGPSQPARLRGVDGEALQGGADGPKDLGAGGQRYYTGYDATGYFRPVPPGADAATVREIAEKQFGLAACEAVSEIGLVAIPDLIIPDLYAAAAAAQIQIPGEGILFAAIPSNALALETLKAGQRDLLAHCRKMGERFAILDAPRGSAVGRGRNKIEEWPNNYQLLPLARHGALYYPWIMEKISDFAGRNLFIPPCGHVAGIYAATERARGVGKAPANEILQGIIALEVALSDADQDLLNPRGVNCLRIFPGRGIRVWGARTLDLDAAWRYVNVRRVALFIIKNILVNLQWTVFEPNDRRLWNKIVATLSLYLRDLFQRGALAGARPEDAFFVKCDETTNPPDVIDRGEVITEVGFAPARPAEFILVTIKRTAEAITVSEPA